MKTKIKWPPKETYHTLKTIVDLVQHDINEINTKKVKDFKSSLSNGEQEAMKHLAKRRGIVTTTLDKGTAVIMKISSKKIVSNYPIKTIAKYFKQILLYKAKKKKTR